MMQFAKENALALVLVVFCTALLGHCRNLQKQITTNKVETDSLYREFALQKGYFSSAMTQVGNRMKTTENTVVLAFELINEKLDGEPTARSSANKPAAIREPQVALPLQRVETPHFTRGVFVKPSNAVGSSHLDRRRHF